MRLEITRKTELALRAVRELAVTGKTRKSDDLAAAIGTTPAFLGQSLAPLVRAQWLRSEPGPRGGYRLSRGHETLSVLDLIEAIEGPTVTGRCVLSRGTCAGAERAGPCALHDAWTRARASLLEQLRSETVLDGQAAPGARATASMR